MARPPKDSRLSKTDMGKRIRSLREERGWSQVAFGRAVGMTQSNVSAVERGDRGLTIHQIVKVAKALGVPADAILTGSKTQKQAGPPGDRRFLRRLHQIDKLPQSDRQALLKTIDAFLTKVS